MQNSWTLEVCGSNSRTFTSKTKFRTFWKAMLTKKAGPDSKFHNIYCCMQINILLRIKQLKSDVQTFWDNISRVLCSLVNIVAAMKTALETLWGNNSIAYDMHVPPKSCPTKITWINQEERGKYIRVSKCPPRTETDVLEELQVTFPTNPFSTFKF